MRYWFDDVEVNKAHHLLIGQSKHLFLKAKGDVGYQKRPIDSRSPGARTPLTRMILLDVPSGVIYGEMHDAETRTDLIGFLTRAWSVKPYVPLHGLPIELKVSEQVASGEEYQPEIEWITEHSHVAIGRLPSGFASGVSATREFERQCTYALPGDRGMSLYVLQALSTNLSSIVSANGRVSHGHAWDDVPPLSAEFIAAVDSLYEKPGAWRAAPYSHCFAP